MTIITFREFALDPAVPIAPVVYRREPHRTTAYGATVRREAAEELLIFVQCFAEFLGLSRPFLRLDVYVSECQLAVLEINAAFVDGWGTALNLSRAAGQAIDPLVWGFPDCFACIDENYLPELELLVAELREHGQPGAHVCTSSKCAEPAYVYGRESGEGNLPERGQACDDKHQLARFAADWPGELVTIPRYYTADDTPWAAVPSDVYLKFADKDDLLCERAGFSVRRGKPAGKAAFFRDCYESGALLAQAITDSAPAQVDGDVYRTQLVVLTNGDLLTGYIQYGTGKLINDDSIHGPLLFSD